QARGGRPGPNDRGEQDVTSDVPAHELVADDATTHLSERTGDVGKVRARDRHEASDGVGGNHTDPNAQFGIGPEAIDEADVGAEEIVSGDRPADVRDEEEVD